MQMPIEDGGAPPSLADIEAVTREILARGEFERGLASDVKTSQSVAEWLRSIFNDIGNWAQEAPGLGTALFVFLLLLLIALVAHIVYTIYTEIPRMRSSRERRMNSATVALEGTATSWEDAIAQVKQALAEKNHHHAAWILHRLFLGLLDQRNLICFKSWKTNTDYLSEISGAHERDLLVSLTECYETIVYAHRPVVLGMLDGLLQQVESARSEP